MPWPLMPQKPNSRYAAPISSTKRRLSVSNRPMSRVGTCLLMKVVARCAGSGGRCYGIGEFADQPLDRRLVARLDRDAHDRFGTGWSQHDAAAAGELAHDLVARLRDHGVLDQL